MQAIEMITPRHQACRLSAVAAEFAGWIATAVWFRRLTDEAARQALWAYAMASHGGAPRESDGMLESLMAEYRRRREQQDLCW